MAKKVVEITQAGVVNLDPAQIQAEDNARYSVKDVDGMMASILTHGGVMVPVEVEPLTQAVNGFTHKLTFGFLRHAAVTRLNSEQGAGLPLPASIHINTSPLERLRRQITENLERQSLSIMDRAVAIKKLLDSGVPKVEVREIFGVSGGRKGNKVQPASNSHINMMLGFLDLPKKYQTKLDTGLLSTTGAYELLKAAPEKRDAILERAETERQSALEKEEREEKRLLEQERKQEELVAKRTKAEQELKAAQDEAQAAQAKLAEKAELAKAAYEATQEKQSDSKARKAIADNFKMAEKDRAAAQSEAEVAEKVYKGLEEKHKKMEELASTHAAKLREAREGQAKGATKKGAAVSGTDVKKAAVAEGASTQYVALSAKECREAAHYLQLPGGNPKTAAIGKVLTRCFLGELTEKQLGKEIDKIVG